MELRDIMDLRNNEELSHFYVTICYNSRAALLEFTLSLVPEAYQRLKMLNELRESILKYLVNSERIDTNIYKELLCNSYEFVTDRTENLTSLVDILKE